MNQPESIATGYLGPVYQVAAVNALPDGSQPDGRVPFVSRNHALLMPATAAVPISIPDTMRTLALLAESQAKVKRQVKSTSTSTGGGSATAARPSRNAAVLDENEAQTVFDATRSYVDMIVDTCASQATFAMLASIKVNKLVPANATLDEHMPLGGLGGDDEMGGGGGLVTMKTHLRPFEMYSIATLCPQSYDEAVTYCPTLRDYDAGSISDVLQMMYQQLQGGTNNM